MSQLSLELEPQYILIVTLSKLSDTPTVAMTVLRQTIKVKKWAVAQFLEIPTPSPKWLEFSSHSLAHEIIHPYKITDKPLRSGHFHLLRWPTLPVEYVSPKASHLLRWPILSGVRISLNKSIS